MKKITPFTFKEIKLVLKYRGVVPETWNKGESVGDAIRRTGGDPSQDEIDAAVLLGIIDEVQGHEE